MTSEELRKPPRIPTRPVSLQLLELHSWKMPKKRKGKARACSEKWADTKHRHCLLGRFHTKNEDLPELMLSLDEKVPVFAC